MPRLIQLTSNEIVRLIQRESTEYDDRLRQKIHYNSGYQSVSRLRGIYIKGKVSIRNHFENIILLVLTYDIRAGDLVDELQLALTISFTILCMIVWQTTRQHKQ